MTDNRYWLFLEGLRRSGAVNMFGAVPFLQEAFGMSFRDARVVLGDWMRSYDPDDYAGAEE